MSASLIESESHTAKQWKSYAIMLVASICVVGLAWSSGYALNLLYPLPPISVDILEFSGYVLWGTGMAKPRINHFINCARSKALNRHLQLFCAEVGIFVFVLARTLVPT
ncbi:MAG: hypothetical protein H0T62_08065 [Parachlamydiaceae bacterium]|nr:hypothetical protein [Parachlamydiaceae bacterium]